MLTNILLYLLKKTGWVEPYIEISNCIIIRKENSPVFIKRRGMINIHDLVIRSLPHQEFNNLFSKELSNLGVGIIGGASLDQDGHITMEANGQLRFGTKGVNSLHTFSK